MYIMIEDPENPGRRLYADLLITTAHHVSNAAHSVSNASINVSILSVDVNDVATESSLAAAIANDLRGVEIPEKLSTIDPRARGINVISYRPDMEQKTRTARNIHKTFKV